MTRIAMGISNNFQNTNFGTDRNEQFIISNCSKYLYRHLSRYSTIDNETMEIVCWTLSKDNDKIFHYLIDKVDESQKLELEEEYTDELDDLSDYAELIIKMIKKNKRIKRRKVHRYILNLLRQNNQQIKTAGKSDIEKNIMTFKTMFNLSDNEFKFCEFLSIVSICDVPENFFVSHLECNKFLGLKYLTNILGMSAEVVTKIIGGTINQIGMLDMDRHDLSLTDDFITLLQNPSDQTFSEKFFQKIPKNNLPLKNHFIKKDQVQHILNLLKDKPKTSTHLLFYGPPGTGKSSFSYGLAKELKIPAYEIVRGEDNTTDQRRAAIIACLNMTNKGKGSIILVDEADNLLNTQFSWFMRGETQDKGWLNKLLEKPGARVIWITNTIRNIEDSVLRRFAYSCHFKSFNRRQRVHLWKSILVKNKSEQLLGKTDIERLAKNYKVSAGAIDLAVNKANESKPSSKKKFNKSVILALDAHLTLLHSGEKPINKEPIENNYSLDGLNIKGDLKSMIDQIDRFDHYLRHSGNEKIVNMNLLFYGPPGTGKSELARYIAERLDREIICKRVSDIHNMYVGETEKNIKNAFAEAETEEAILIFDEADSLLFNRDGANQSWEISFTNEFLTQMERFRGILICTTNRMKDLDEASIRRFNYKMGFDYLKPEGNVIFYQKMLLSLTKKQLDKRDRERLMKITRLTPGDFKIVRDKHFLISEAISPSALINALREEADVKREHAGEKAIGF